MRKYEHNGTSAKFAVRKTTTGLGLFTKVPLSKGELVVEYTGLLLPAEEAYRRGGRYLFEVNSRWIIDGAGRENVSRYINHSCRPNCYIDIRDGIIWIRASRAIRKGEELTYNYNTDGEGLIKCQCRPGCQTLL